MKWNTFTFLFIVSSYNSLALDINGNEEVAGEKSGLVSLYLFNETTGPYLDSAGNGTPLNLTVAPAANSVITRAPGYLFIDGDLPIGAIASPAPATKIIDQCKTSNELTIEAYIKPTYADQNGPARIITLSTDSQSRNFMIGQTYDGSGHYVFRVRTTRNGNNGANNQPETPSGVLQENLLQHVVATRDSNGNVRIYVDRALVTEANDNSLRGRFSNWDDTMGLSLGNEFVDERHWHGELHMVAIYCRAKTIEEIIGDVAFIEMPTVTPKPNDNISQNQTLALQLFKKLNGIRIPIDSPVIAEMATHISQGDLLAAAKIATDQPSFYNFVVRDFAAKMSTRDETVKTPLNDFIATTIGVVRDDLSAKTLLTGDFFYKGAAGKTAVRSNLVTDIIASNTHYQELERQNYDLATALERETGQKILDSSGQAVENPDAAGLLTTRAFMEAHATAGTNRRLVEFTFRQFLCEPIERWADASSSDAHIGRDIDRYPGGDNSKFQTTCKACHANMDGLRGAFARFDFDNGIIKNALFLPNGDGELEMKQAPIGISEKLNQNSEVFPMGHETVDSTWINNAARGSNLTRFGWRTPAGEFLTADSTLPTGVGIQQFGEMIANSYGFSKCMAKRTFASVCGRDIADDETQMIESLAQSFEADGHNLKKLFQRVATRSECMGLEVTGGQ